ncbi:hypothetical protein FOS14_14830 [Skermania sp. ID1734]|uniref:hypothetical protein n=1 Tax=Skermania sp. ID1734 TaxID=2597516 RepID=UPI0011800B28|nr:hypothetical protein [Skermania sp. ID1734]TSD97260.1 hypothetical protein FOS14_14830 [Skermania sp. ID1734]
MAAIALDRTPAGSVAAPQVRAATGIFARLRRGSRDGFAIDVQYANRNPMICWAVGRRDVDHHRYS